MKDFFMIFANVLISIGILKILTAFVLGIIRKVRRNDV